MRAVHLRPLDHAVVYKQSKLSRSRQDLLSRLAKTGVYQLSDFVAFSALPPTCLRYGGHRLSLRPLGSTCEGLFRTVLLSTQPRHRCNLAFARIGLSSRSNAVRAQSCASGRCGSWINCSIRSTTVRTPCSLGMCGCDAACMLSRSRLQTNT